MCCHFLIIICFKSLILTTIATKLLCQLSLIVGNSLKTTHGRHYHINFTFKIKEILDKLKSIPKTSYYQQLLFSVSIYRSSHWSCSIKKGVNENFLKFTGKHLCQKQLTAKSHKLFPQKSSIMNVWKGS